MPTRLILHLVFGAAWLVIACGRTLPAAAEQFTVEKTAEGVTVKLDGSLFTKYLTKSGNKPILWPIVGPTGKEMTRGFPMDKTGAVSNDHVHQRSLWFGYGDVNGTDLWTEGTASGSIAHREFVEIKGGTTAKIVAASDWLDKGGKKMASEQRTITCSTDGGNRIIDFDITITASEGKIQFGDTKEGALGIRVPDALRVTGKKNTGHIVNSRGQRDQDAWGQPADWVDYQGPIDEEVVGIAILNHPSSFGAPTRWQVRNYGLFAANPLATAAFPGGKSLEPVSIDAGDTLQLRYRLIFHKGDQQEAKIAEAFKAYGGDAAPAP